MSDKSVIGDVIVHKGMPPDGNPYRIFGLIGDERMIALLEFHDTGESAGHTFWHAPCSGGARQITKDDVRWDTCGVPELRRKVEDILQLREHFSRK